MGLSVLGTAGVADAAKVKGKVAGFRGLVNPVWDEARDPKKRGYSFREIVPTVRPEFRQLCGLSRLTGDVIQDELLRDRKELSEEEEARQKQAFEAELKKLLGPARFADFERAQQPEFREAFEFTEEHHLPATTAAKIGDAMRHAGEQANEIKQNQSLSPDEQIAALTVLKSVTVNTLSAALGSKYAEYAKTKGTALDDLIELPSTTVERRP